MIFINNPYYNNTNNNKKTNDSYNMRITFSFKLTRGFFSNIAKILFLILYGLSLLKKKSFKKIKIYYFLFTNININQS